MYAMNAKTQKGASQSLLLKLFWVIYAVDQSSFFLLENRIAAIQEITIIPAEAPVTVLEQPDDFNLAPHASQTLFLSALTCPGSLSMPHRLQSLSQAPHRTFVENNAKRSKPKLAPQIISTYYFSSSKAPLPRPLKNFGNVLLKRVS